MSIGKRIKAARKKANLTQKELGEKLGISYQSIAQWENDARRPKHETLQRIADGLGISINYFYGDTAEKQTPGSSEEKQVMFCPFKKIIERNYNAITGKVTIYERFAPCAGEQCMAYEKGPFDEAPNCKRLDSKD